jgi:predicted nucleotidyltransferase
MGIDTLKVADVRLYGSNAAYTYTKHSDIDLHILVDMSDIQDDEVYLELFNSKKRLYNDNLDITVRRMPVELYMQNKDDIVKSLGDYSVLNDRWIKFPTKSKASIEEHSVREKFKRLIALSELALRSGDIDTLDNLLDTLKRYRKAGLEEGGEFSPENLAFKALRSRGIVDKLYKHRDRLHSWELSIVETAFTMMEASGYIPSEAERNDPRFKTSLTVDVGPYTMKQGAIAMGLGNIKRDGRPQQLKASGKFTR